MAISRLGLSPPGALFSTKYFQKIAFSNNICTCRKGSYSQLAKCMADVSVHSCV